MSRRLILMRHAKSSWSQPGLSDHARPLNKRGQRGATAIGHWLANAGYLPEVVLSSDSQRTRQTWASVSAAFSAPPNPIWMRDLYHAGADEMRAILQAAEAQTVMVIGHNPGCGCLAADLVAETPAHDRFDDYPTAATLVAEFDINTWRDMGLYSAKPVAFVVPSDLDIT